MKLEELKTELRDLLKKIDETRAKWNMDGVEPTAEELDAAQKDVDRVNFIRSLIDHEEKTQRALDAGNEPANKPKTVIDDPPAGGEKRVIDPKKEFRNGGEFFKAVYQAGCPDSYLDPRLSQRAVSGLGESVSSDGGFLIPTQFSNELIKNVWDNSIVPSRVRRIPITSNAITIPGIDETSRATGSRSGGIRAYWAAEADAKTASQPKFRKIELKLKKLIGLCYATDELLEDATALDSIIRNGFKDEFDFALTDAIVNGLGAGTPLGIMSAGCLVTASKVAGQTATTFITENVLEMFSRLKATSMPNATWLINQDVLPSIWSMSLAVGTAGGELVYMPAGGVSGRMYDTILGRPMFPIEHCQTLGTAGDVILADLSQYVMVEKGGMSSDVSIHVRFVYDESVFRFVMRVDGQPVLASAITPYKGTDTVSHFVCVETRS